MDEDDDLLFLTLDEQVRSALNARPLDPSDPWTALVLNEQKLISVWSGIDVELVATDRGTCVHGPSRIVGLNMKQLHRLFGDLKGEALRTAIFFALAHENGHVQQHAHIPNIGSVSRIHREAHADILGGVWTAVRLMGGQARLPDHLRDVGLSFKGGHSNYPSTYQRTCIIERGTGDGLLAVDLDERANVPADARVLQTLSECDVRDLLETARKTLAYTPDEWPLST